MSAFSNLNIVLPAFDSSAGPYKPLFRMVKFFYPITNLIIMEKLSGMLVMVDPELSDNWPSRGQIGFIASMDEKKQAVMVGFGSLEMYAFPPEALMVMRAKTDLYKVLMSQPSDMQTADFKVLMRANLLQESGDRNDTLKALEMLKDSPGARSFGMESLQVVLELKQAQNANQSFISR